MNNKALEFISLGDLTEPSYLTFNAVVNSKNLDSKSHTKLMLEKPTSFLNKRPKTKKEVIKKST